MIPRVQTFKPRFLTPLKSLYIPSHIGLTNPESDNPRSTDSQHHISHPLEVLIQVQVDAARTTVGAGHLVRVLGNLLVGDTTKVDRRCCPGKGWHRRIAAFSVFQLRAAARARVCGDESLVPVSCTKIGDVGFAVLERGARTRVLRKNCCIKSFIMGAMRFARATSIRGALD
jgi:hypothetical protein